MIKAFGAPIGNADAKAIADLPRQDHAIQTSKPAGHGR
jgi:hypothetical protein